MFPTDKSRRIKELESQLTSEEEKYVIAVRSRKGHNTVRKVRENISNIKKQLEQLYNSCED
jgi:hypothetical protein